KWYLDSAAPVNDFRQSGVDLLTTIYFALTPLSRLPRNSSLPSFADTLNSRPGGSYMPVLRRLLLLAVLILVPASAQENRLSSEKRALMEKAVSAFMSANSVPGL